MPFNPYMFNPRAFDSDFDETATNPFTSMRQKSIFQPPTTPEDNTKRFLSQTNPPPSADLPELPKSNDQTGPKDDAMSYYQAMRDRQKPGPALTAYQAALKEQPTDENTPISTGRKIMGTLAGIAGGFAGGPAHGISSANEIIDAPYKTAIRDYQGKMKNLGESAKMEQDQQESDLKAMEAAQRMHLDYTKFDFERLKEKALEGDRAAQREIAARNAASAERQAGAAESRAGTDATRAKDQGRNIDSEIQTRKDQTKIGMGNLDVNRTNAQTNRNNSDELVNWHKAQIKLKGAEGKLVSPAQQNMALDLVYREAAQDPTMKEFVHQTPNGFWEVDPSKVIPDSAGYNLFQNWVQRRAQSAIDRNKLVPFSPIHEDDINGGDWEISPSGGRRR